jgi:hypothetical protein
MMGLGRSLFLAERMWAVSSNSSQAGIFMRSLEECPLQDRKEGLLVDCLRDCVSVNVIAVGKVDNLVLVFRSRMVLSFLTISA